MIAEFYGRGAWLVWVAISTTWRRAEAVNTVDWLTVIERRDLMGQVSSLLF